MTTNNTPTPPDDDSFAAWLKFQVILFLAVLALAAVLFAAGMMIQVGGM